MITRHPRSNAYAAAARHAKATALARTLRSVGASAEVAYLLDDEGWANAERAAGVRPSSPETRAMVLRMLREDA